VGTNIVNSYCLKESSKREFRRIVAYVPVGESEHGDLTMLMLEDVREWVMTRTHCSQRASSFGGLTRR
jgi:hypothetical protein